MAELLVTGEHLKELLTILDLWHMNMNLEAEEADRRLVAHEALQARLVRLVESLEANDG